MHYAIHNPYGIECLNRNGNQANELHAFASGPDADEWVRAEPAKRTPVEEEFAAQIQSRVSDAGGNPHDFPLPFMDA